MDLEERREFEDRYGYQSGRCPKCHRRVWSDTGRFECSYCGYDSHPNEGESDPDDNAEPDAEEETV